MLSYFLYDMHIYAPLPRAKVRSHFYLCKLHPGEEYGTSTHFVLYSKVDSKETKR